MRSALTYERIAKGEIPALTADGDEIRVEKLSKDDEEFLRLNPSAMFVRRLQARRERKRRAVFLATSGALAACLAAAIALPSLAAREEAARIKGGDLEMFAYRKKESGNEILAEDIRLEQGEEIQLAYFAREKSFAAILSVDGRGKITRHMPLHGTEALAIDTPSFALLPYSYKLDDAPSFEDIYFIASPDRFKIAEIEPFLSAGYDNGTPAILLPSPYRYARLRILKTEVSE